MTEKEHPCAYHPFVPHANSNSAYKRTIRNDSKLDHWCARNSSVQMNELLNPWNYEKPTSECSCECIDVCPPKVTRTTGRIRWRGNKNKPTTSSRYHAKCLPNKPQPKIQATNITRNVITSSHCDECVQNRKKGKFKNQCYCLSPPNKPLLPVKPLVSQPQPNSKRIIKSGFKTEADNVESGVVESGYNLETLKKAKNLLDYAPESEFLRKLLQEASKTFDCQCSACTTKCKLANMKYTKRRQLLEDAYDEVDTAVQSLEDIATLHHRCKMKCEGKGCSYRDLTSAKNLHSSMSPQYSPRTSRHYSAVSPGNSPRTSRHYTIVSAGNSPRTQHRYNSEFSPRSSPKFNSAVDVDCEVDCDKISAIKRIRDENYFDTHSTNFNLSPQNIPAHKCVYKFALDNRLLPTPLHSDAYGVSRCSKCNKPMASSMGKKLCKEEKLQKVTDYTKEESAICTQHMRQQSKERNHQGSQSKNFSRKINIAGKNEIVELKVPPPPLLLSKTCKLKITVPDNTWALRYQKGVI